jgi:hypothetical protein
MNTNPKSSYSEYVDVFINLRQNLALKSIILYIKCLYLQIYFFRIMASPSGLGSSRKDVLSKKEEFFRNLNLLATKRVKVKYCRTIKERLRQMQL